MVSARRKRRPVEQQLGAGVSSSHVPSHQPAHAEPAASADSLALAAEPQDVRRMTDKPNDAPATSRAPGAVFLTIGASFWQLELRQRAFIAVGAAFIAIGVALLVRQLTRVVSKPTAAPNTALQRTSPAAPVPPLSLKTLGGRCAAIALTVLCVPARSACDRFVRTGRSTSSYGCGRSCSTWAKPSPQVVVYGSAGSSKSQGSQR